MADEESKIVFTEEQVKKERLFKDCTYLLEGQGVYRKLLKDNHPDQGGNENVAREIIAQFKTFLRRAIKTAPTATREEQEADKNRAVNVTMEDILFEVESRINCRCEVKGDWIFCSEVAVNDGLILTTLGFNYSKRLDVFIHMCGVVPSTKPREQRHFFSNEELTNLWGSRKVKDKKVLGG